MDTCNNAFPLSIDSQPDNFTFDGRCYYFTVQDSCDIVKTDKDFCFIKTIPTKRHYDHICYDRLDKCFWASSKYCPGNVFKLNYCMAEIDRIRLCGSKCTSGVITGISLNCCENLLIIAFTNCIISLDKHNETVEVKYTPADIWITSVLSICPGYIITGVKNCRQYIFVMDETFAVTLSWAVDCDTVIRNIIINPCKPPNLYLEFLATQKGYPYIYRRNLPCGLGFTPCRCNYEKCKPCCHPCCKDPCAEIMESIALEESSIACILNAEGEKIQKVLASTDDVQEILCVNREVNKTIINATHLEQVLYSKLAALSECCDFCHNPCIKDCSECDKEC